MVDFRPFSFLTHANSPFTCHLPRLCPSTVGCSPPSVPSIVLCLLLSCSRWFPPSLLCHLAIFYLVIPLISSLSLVASLCSVWSTYYPSFLLHVWPISFFVSVCILKCQLSLFFSWSLSIASRLVALDLTFSSPLLFERFSVCFSIVIERPCFAAVGHCWQDTGVHYLFFEWYGELTVLDLEYFKNSSTLLWSWHRFVLL